ncbi:MAG: hypothetical protein Q4P29_04035 [Tissierellia bacterium]|nr:hypothetical protein [Tissierellia bacterium]
MYALFLVLNDLTKFDEILAKLYELNLGVTSMDSAGMKSVIQGNIKADICDKEKDNKCYSKTLVSIIKDEKLLDEAIKELNLILENENKKGRAFIFVLPVIKTDGGYTDEHEH